MRTLNNIPAAESPVHLLLVASTKIGKSTYAAQAALDGFHVIYIDRDNGQSALRYALRNDPSASDRVHLFSPSRGLPFVKAVLRSQSRLSPCLWLPDEDKVYISPKTARTIEDPDRKLWAMSLAQVPNNYVLCIDTWSSLAAESLGLSNPDKLSTLLDGQADQSVYGEAKANMDYVANLIQKLRCHVIVQGHPTRYEIYDKPVGSSGATLKQRDMILKDTVEVPISSSRVHGKELGSRFNHIGWLELNSLGTVEIDFTRKRDRIGGGPPDRKEKAAKLSFLQLVKESGGGLPDDLPPSDSWFWETTVGEYESRKASEVAALKESKPGEAA